MKPADASSETIDGYIAGSPPHVQDLLAQVRATIREAAPDAQEMIKYRIPTFFLHENLVHFAAFKHHIGFYPTSSGISNFEDELSSYERTKGAVRFPLDRPMPLRLIRKIVKFRVKEARERAAAKKKR
jgi:uncharacterized protein YdhG (YjbR/CyaY superfamily)